MENIPSGEWLVRFAARLREINPKSRSRGFMQAAWEIHRRHADMPPEAAAEQFAADLAAPLPSSQRESS